MLRGRRSRARKAVVIGGGLLGLEAAAGLAARGMDVTVLHLMPTLMERQLDPAAGYLLQKAIEQRGIAVAAPAPTPARSSATARSTACGSRTARDLAGRSRRDGGRHPARTRARQGGRARGQARHRRRRPHAHQRSRHLRGRRMRRASRPLLRPGRAALRHGEGRSPPTLAGERRPAYAGSVTSTKLKVTGVDLFSAGDFAEGDGPRRDRAARSRRAASTSALVLRDEPHRRRGALRRYRRRLLVSSTC